MKTNIYVAGSLRNISKIKNIMDEKGTKQCAEEDIKGLKECDCLIYCMDSNHSRGKNFELGYITALGKPIIIYIMPGEEISEKLPIDSLIDNECIFIRAKLRHKIITFKNKTKTNRTKNRRM